MEKRERTDPIPRKGNASCVMEVSCGRTRKQYDRKKESGRKRRKRKEESLRSDWREKGRKKRQLPREEEREIWLEAERAKGKQKKLRFSGCAETTKARRGEREKLFHFFLSKKGEVRQLLPKREDGENSSWLTSTVFLVHRLRVPHRRNLERVRIVDPPRKGKRRKAKEGSAEKRKEKRKKGGQGILKREKTGGRIRLLSVFERR